MNQLQTSFAKGDDSLGKLLVQIEAHYDNLPESLRSAFDSLGASSKWGCHCDLDEGREPDDCVMDEGRHLDCVYATEGGNKVLCEYWQPIQFKR